jgi:propanol-preferring alcohol dehydrogenase
MKAMRLNRCVDLQRTKHPLELVDLPIPDPGPNQLLVKVAACGVCHTELDEIEGRTRPPHFPITPGHEVVGRIVAVGPGVTSRQIGARVGVGWIHSGSGTPEENLGPNFVATGRDVDGGYAEYMIAHDRYACPIPEAFSDAEAAPLLCAGAIGYRALRLANIHDGDTLGLTGFGGSAHLVLQLVRYLYPETRIHVFARDESAQRFATELGATWVGTTEDKSPELLHAIIDTTPAWKPVVEALGNLRPGGRLVINAIRKEDRDREYLLKLDYARHLWMEKEIKSVANITRYDIAEFLQVAAQIPIRPHVTTYRLEEANQALLDLARNTIKGAKVLIMDKG